MAATCDDEQRWLVFVMGATACGKSAVADYLAGRLHAKYIEGDDFHPQANIDKMSHGQSLTDADRWGWLQAISAHAAVHLRGPGTHHLIVTCSALKREYRALLREGARAAGDLRLLFVFLDVPETELVRRATRRAHHFVHADLVHSQLQILERPNPQEEPDVLTVDGNHPLAEVQTAVLAAVEKVWAQQEQKQGIGTHA